MSRTIDVTPTWSALLPTIRLILENAGTEEARENMWGELARMALAADKWNAAGRRAKP